MRSTKPNLRLVQGERSKRAILEATAKLMATSSGAATTIAAIAKACGRIDPERCSMENIGDRGQTRKTLLRRY